MHNLSANVSVPENAQQLPHCNWFLTAPIQLLHLSLASNDSGISDKETSYTLLFLFGAIIVPNYLFANSASVKSLNCS